MVSRSVDRSRALQAFEKIGIGDIEFGDRRRAGVGEKARPRDIRGQCGQFGYRHDVIDVLGVALGSDVHGDLGQRGFHLHDLLRVAGSGASGSPMSLSMLAMCCDILLARLFCGVTGAEIVVALGQAKTALVHNGDLLAWRL